MGGKRRQRGMIEVLEDRRLLSYAWVTLGGPAGGSGPSGAPVEGDTLTYTVNYYWDSPYAPGGTVNVGYSGSAEADSDYQILTSSVTVPSNPNPYPTGGAVSFTVPIKRDNLVEDPESLIVALSSTSPNLKLRPYGMPDYLDATPYIQSNVSILDDPPVVSIVATDSSAAETYDGETPDPGQFTIYRTGGDTSTPISVSVGLSGTAVLGANYTLNPGTNVSVGTSATIDASIIDDHIDDGDKTIIATLSGGSSVYKTGTPSAGQINVKERDITLKITSATLGWDATTRKITLVRPAAGGDAVETTLTLEATSNGSPVANVTLEDSVEDHPSGIVSYPLVSLGSATDSSGITHPKISVSSITTPGDYKIRFKIGFDTFVDVALHVD